MKIDRAGQSSASGAVSRADSSPSAGSGLQQLRVGQVLAGTVLGRFSHLKYLVDFGRFRANADAKVPLRVGTRIRVRVEQTSGGAMFKLLESAPAESSDATARAARALGVVLTPQLRGRLDILLDSIAPDDEEAALLALGLLKKSPGADTELFSRARQILAEKLPGQWIADLNAVRTALGAEAEGNTVLLLQELDDWIRDRGSGNLAAEILSSGLHGPLVERLEKIVLHTAEHKGPAAEAALSVIEGLTADRLRLWLETETGLVPALPLPTTGPEDHELKPAFLTYLPLASAVFTLSLVTPGRESGENMLFLHADEKTAHLDVAAPFAPCLECLRTLWEQAMNGSVELRAVDASRGLDRLGGGFENRVNLQA